MSHSVKCDIRRGIYNRSDLSSHKRLSHDKEDRSTGVVRGEAGNLEAITVSMYQQLPEESKREAGISCLALVALTASRTGAVQPYAAGGFSRIFKSSG